jgi:hypothetical protein
LFIGNWDITSRSVDGISSLETLNETFVFTTSADGSQTEGTAIHSSDGYDNNLSFTLKASQDSIIFTKESGSTMRCYYEMFETHFTLRYQAEEGITQENWEKQ